MSQRRLHLIVGLAAVAAFLASGRFMRTHFPEVYAGNESIRYLLRANHIYILMSGLVNLMAALAVKPVASNWRVAVSWLSTACLLIAPVLLAAGFWFEAVSGMAVRRFTFYGVLSLVVGVVSAYISSMRFKRVLECDANSLCREGTKEDL